MNIFSLSNPPAPAGEDLLSIGAVPAAASGLEPAASFEAVLGVSLPATSSDLLMIEKAPPGKAAASSLAFNANFVSIQGPRISATSSRPEELPDPATIALSLTAPVSVAATAGGNETTVMSFGASEREHAEQEPHLAALESRELLNPAPVDPITQAAQANALVVLAEPPKINLDLPRPTAGSNAGEPTQGESLQPVSGTSQIDNVVNAREPQVLERTSTAMPMPAVDAKPTASISVREKTPLAPSGTAPELQKASRNSQAAREARTYVTSAIEPNAAPVEELTPARRVMAGLRRPTDSVRTALSSREIIGSEISTQSQTLRSEFTPALGTQGSVSLSARAAKIVSRPTAPQHLESQATPNVIKSEYRVQQGVEQTIQRVAQQLDVSSAPRYQAGFSGRPTPSGQGASINESTTVKPGVIPNKGADSSVQELTASKVQLMSKDASAFVQPGASGDGNKLDQAISASRPTLANDVPIRPSSAGTSERYTPQQIDEAGFVRRPASATLGGAEQNASDAPEAGVVLSSGAQPESRELFPDVGPNILPGLEQFEARPALRTHAPQRETNVATRVSSSGTLDAQQDSAMALAANSETVIETLGKNIPSVGKNDGNSGLSEAAARGGMRSVRIESGESRIVDVSLFNPSGNGEMQTISEPASIDSEQIGSVTQFRLTDEIWSAVERFRATSREDWVVTIRPDRETHLNLQIKMRDEQLIVQATLESGNWDAVAPQWSELQASLAERGVQLKALEVGSGAGAETQSNQYSTNSNSNGQRQAANDFEYAREFAETARDFAQRRAESQKPAFATPARTNSPARPNQVLETWA